MQVKNAAAIDLMKHTEYVIVVSLNNLSHLCLFFLLQTINAHQLHGLSNHQQFDTLFISLSRLTTKKATKACQISKRYYHFNNTPAISWIWNIARSHGKAFTRSYYRYSHWGLVHLHFGVGNTKNASINTSRPRQNVHHFPDDNIQMHFLEWKCMNFTIKIPLRFVPKGAINNIPALVQIMAWHRPGD